MPVQGEGQYYCKQYRTPSYLDEEPEKYSRVEDFDRTAALYEVWSRPFAQPLFEETLTLMSPFLVPSARILDLSCGPGTETCELAAVVPQGEVVGVDLSAGMVETAFENARQRGVKNTAFFQADVLALPEHFEGCFDIVYCACAFHHYPQPAVAMKEIYRILNDGGKAFILDPGTGWFNALFAPLSKWGDSGWVGFYTGEGFQSLFREAGFSAFYWNEILPGYGVSIGTKGASA